MPDEMTPEGRPTSEEMAGIRARIGDRLSPRIARKLECASCWLSPADVATVVLHRINRKGKTGVFLCEECLPPMQPAISSAALAAPAEAETTEISMAHMNDGVKHLSADQQRAYDEKHAYRPSQAEAERAVVEAAMALMLYMGAGANQSSVWREFVAACDALAALRARGDGEGEKGGQHMEEGRFHWTEGWYFKRMDNGPTPGSVLILKEQDGQVIAKAVIPAAEWESIISFVSAKGEPRNYEAAIAFHMEP